MNQKCKILVCRYPEAEILQTNKENCYEVTLRNGWIEISSGAYVVRVCRAVKSHISR
jgi:hypothetical protein